MLFYLIYVFSTLVLGAFKIGPYSVRVYCCIIMALYMILKLKSSSFHFNSHYRIFFTSYIVLLVIFGMTLYLNGEIYDFQYFQFLLSNHLPNIVLVFSSCYFIKSRRDLNKLIYLLIFIILLTSIATFLQYFGHPLGTSLLWMFINSTSAQTTLTDLIDQSSGGGALGSGFAGGIFGYVFLNGLFISSCGLLPVIFLSRSQKPLAKFFVMFLLLFFLLACFMTQERASFFTMLASLLFLIHFKLKRSSFKVFLYLLLLYVIAFFVLNPNSLQLDLGRFSDVSLKEDSRSQIWVDAYAFISSNLFLGGPLKYSSMYEIAPHNLFLNAFINCGLIGGFFMIFIYLKLIFRCFQILIHPSRYGSDIITISLIICIIVFYSLFHNASLLTGDCLILLFPFILYRLLGFKQSYN